MFRSKLADNMTKSEYILRFPDVMNIFRALINTDTILLNTDIILLNTDTKPNHSRQSVSVQ